MIARCLAMFALALGLVLMHHTVIAGPTAAGFEHGTAHTAGDTAAHAAPHAVPAPSPPGHGHGQGHEDGHAGMLLHLCLAVLAALGVLLLVARYARRLPPSDDDRRDGIPMRTLPAPARPPPVPLRLARLRVLRL